MIKYQLHQVINLNTILNNFLGAIAQVYYAGIFFKKNFIFFFLVIEDELHQEKEVAVKIRHPKAEWLIKLDLTIMKFIVYLVNKFYIFYKKKLIIE